MLDEAFFYLELLITSCLPWNYQVSWQYPWITRHQPNCPLGQVIEILSRPELRDFLESFKIAALWFGLFLISWYTISLVYWLVFSKTHFKNWCEQPIARQHIASKIMSMGHALACIYLAIAPIYNGPHWNDYNTPDQTFLMQVSLGYFWADLVYICFLDQDWMFLIHHGAMIVYWGTCLYSGQGGYYGLLAVLPGELSNPFQIIWDYARVYKFRRLFAFLTPVYTYLFIFLRCLVIPVMSPYMLYHILIYCTAPIVFRILWVASASVMLLAGGVWSRMIWKGYCKFCQKTLDLQKTKEIAEQPDEQVTSLERLVEARIEFRVKAPFTPDLFLEELHKTLENMSGQGQVIELKFDPVKNHK